jgi:hypothetical protein
MYKHPALGDVVEYSAGQILGLPSIQFCNDDIVGGAARIEGDKVELWALFSHRQRRGHFRKFIKDCQEYFQEIWIMYIDNPWLPEKLEQYGFTRVDNQLGITMRWSRDESSQTNPDAIEESRGFKADSR